MFLPRLTDCVDCTQIPSLLSKIDIKLTDYANQQYNNIVYSINQNIPSEVVNDLLTYKQILTYKLCNPDYCACYTVPMIASRVIVLIHK